MPVLSAPEGAEKVAVGNTEYQVAGGRIEAAIEHVEALVSHGYREIAGEVKQALSKKPGK